MSLTPDGADELDRAAAWQLAAELGERARTALLAATAAGRAADQALAEAQAARGTADDLASVLRALVATLSGLGADLGSAVERARQAVGLPPVS